MNWGVFNDAGAQKISLVDLKTSHQTFQTFFVKIRRSLEKVLNPPPKKPIKRIVSRKIFKHVKPGRSISNLGRVRLKHTSSVGSVILTLFRVYLEKCMQYSESD